MLCAQKHSGTEMNVEWWGNRNNRLTRKGTQSIMLHTLDLSPGGSARKLDTVCCRVEGCKEGGRKDMGEPFLLSLRS